MNDVAINAPFPDFESWIEANDGDLWAEFHETGAYYEMDYEVWLEQKYERAGHRMTFAQEKR